MSAFQFQFQYDPADLKAIREANETAIYSPATTISVWAAGLAVALLILGANGMWPVLFVVAACAAVFVTLYVSGLPRKSFADREYRVRTLTLSETGIVEEFGSSMFEKSWSAYEELNETELHFLLRHYEKVTAIPKRVISEGQLDDCRRYIQNHMARHEIQQLQRFDTMFLSNEPYDIHRFRWEAEDMVDLHRIKMQRFGESEATESGRSSTLRRFYLMMLIYVGIALAMFVMSRYFSQTVEVGALRILAFAVAIMLPFFVAYFWWRLTSSKASSRSPRIPDEEISITLNESDLMIGYREAIARYSWQDITGFYFSRDFIGFQPTGGMVHVIANRAFGGKENARDFWRWPSD